MAVVAALTGGGVFGSPAPVHAGPFDLFTGSFSATGTVVEGPRAESHSVTCSFVSSPNRPTSFGLRGKCWAYRVFSRSISADLALDPRSGRVTGTYIGARVGTARLSGQQQGSLIKLSIIWPAPVFGNMTSAMTIARNDHNHLRITVLSRIGADGPIRATTDLLLRRN